ncbi:arsenite efflux transporter metallochaperone ArsD [Alkalicoccus urumqiensis]|uniref:Arsenical resistance operon transcriptional repressor ArsD n=1 Tax=Alkalicoccus urumqiensis TaxID=1548213 RepID=A0A2P6MI30_ALKUR|nr:arsenite efflux transporter metallochaperone ArsD [Alkalicoccus urumqiensis]PRO65949.1 arsenical resistance operon transcriptional repressor ArsD [Alkalicoccus urumqiensis]
MSKKIEVFDPALCCSTGVCGPDVDPALTKMAKLHLDVEKAGYELKRYNLAQEPGPFVETPSIQKLLEDKGPDGLPAVTVDGELKKEGSYPDAAEVAAWLGIEESSLQHSTPKNQINLL